MKNGLKYEKKSGILDQKDIISKGRWLKLAVWERVCVCETMWKLFSLKEEIYFMMAQQLCRIGKMFFMLWSSYCENQNKLFRIRARDKGAITGS